VFASTEHNVLRFGFLTQYPCVLLCFLTTFYTIDHAWFRRLKLKHDKLLSSSAFNFTLRRYTMGTTQGFLPEVGSYISVTGKISEYYTATQMVDVLTSSVIKAVGDMPAGGYIRPLFSST